MFIQQPLISNNRLVTEHQVVGVNALKMRPRIRASAALTFLLLAGCSSGGNTPLAVVTPTPTPTPAPTVAFTSWSAIPTPGTVTVTGSTIEASYISNPLVTDFPVTSHTAPTTGTASGSITYNAAGAKTAVAITGRQSGVSFNSTELASTGTVVLGAAVTTSTDGKTQMIYSDTTTLGINYQAYGIWATGLGTGSGFGGAASIGSLTPTSAVPTTGTATFTGGVGGLLIDTTGLTYLVRGNSSVVANFATRSLAYSTTGSTFTTGQSASGLNMNGTLTYSAGSGNFTGPITSSSISSGTAQGSFYGPTATEVGGTFAMTGTGVQTFFGAFGAKR